MRLIRLIPLLLIGATTPMAVSAQCNPSDLAISLDDSVDPVVAGTQLTYTVTVTNLDGSNTACGVEVSISLPAGTSFDSSAGCSEDPGGENTCSLGSIGPGFNKAATLLVTVASDTTGSLGANVSVSATTVDGNAANDADAEATDVISVADLEVAATADSDVVIPGDILDYQISVTNTGPSDAEDTELTLTLPDQVSLIATAGCLDDPNGVPLCRLQTLGAGDTEQVALKVQVTDSASGSLRLRAEATTTATDPDPSDDVALVTTPVSVEDRVGEGSSPAAAGDPLASQRLTVVWQGRAAEKAAGEGIIGRIFDDGGMPVGIEFRLDASGSSHQSPDVATLDGSRFVAVWQSQDADGSGVFARRFDDAGMPVGIEFQINQSTALEQSDPAVFGTGAGFAVTWVDEESLGSFVRALRLFDDGGMPVGIELRFGASDVDAKPPAIAASGSGILAAWEDASDRVAAQLFTSDGMPVGIELVIAQTGANAHPAVAPGPSGGFLVVWQNESGADSDGAGIFGRLFDDAGMPVGIEFQLNATSTGDQRHPAIAASPDGTYAVTWQGPDNDGSGIYARRLDEAGMPVGIELRMNLTGDGEQESAEPAFVDSDGTFYVAWQSDDGGDSDVILSPPSLYFADGFETGDVTAWSFSQP